MTAAHDRKTKQMASRGEGKYRVSAEVNRIGNDLLVSVWGGTRPHIGSVSVSVPRPGLTDPGDTSSTSSIINLTGHKDEIVARLFSEKMAAAFNTNCIATAGIHIDRITEKEIDTLMNNCSRLCQHIIQQLESTI